MTLIAQFMPHPRLRQVERIAVRSDVEMTWRVVRSLDTFDVPFFRTLVALRIWPERLIAKLRGRHEAPLPRHSTIEDIVAHKEGFVLLGETPGREVVLGAIGKFWHPTIEWFPADPHGFARFGCAGWGKVVWNLRVDPRAGGGSWITCEVRVDANDDVSWRKFRAYWRLIGPFSHALRKTALAELEHKLGKPRARIAYPGDEILPSARVDLTHVRLIDAPPARVWPWLVQMGGQRAGWYSWDQLDHAGIPSARRILPEFQDLEVGDLIAALPTGDGGFGVLRLERDHLLVLGSPSLLPGAKPDGAPYHTSWAFVVEPIGDDATELTVRVRADYRPGARMAVLRPALTLLHEVMERKQLRGLRERAELPAKA